MGKTKISDPCTLQPIHYKCILYGYPSPVTQWNTVKTKISDPYTPQKLWTLYPIPYKCILYRYPSPVTHWNIQKTQISDPYTHQKLWFLYLYRINVYSTDTHRLWHTETGWRPKYLIPIPIPYKCILCRYPSPVTHWNMVKTKKSSPYTHQNIWSLHLYPINVYSIDTRCLWHTETRWRPKYLVPTPTKNSDPYTYTLCMYTL